MFRWLRRIFGRETVEDVYEARGVNVNERPPLPKDYRPIRTDRYVSTIPQRPITTYNNPPVRETVIVQNNNDDFLTGFLVAEAVSGGNAEAGLVGGSLGGVSGGLIAGELMPEHHTESFSAPDPDPTPCDTSSYDSGSSDSSSCSDSSSSFDSSSFDSGSSDSGGGW